MIEIQELFKIFRKNKINFFTGVPDSVLKNFSSYIDKKKYKNIIDSNEGAAVAIASGYHLSSKKIACVYMQNSGLGNAINPLISIANKNVYNIPMLLLIGWRGAPLLKDEPQHIEKGKITTNLLRLLRIKYCILDAKKDLKKLNKLIKNSKKNIIACLIKDKKLNYKNKNIQINVKKYIDKKKFLEILLKNVNKNSKIISTTGYTSRELLKVRSKLKIKNNSKDFYMVGGMGHASMLSFGFSLFSKKNVICLDGDGSIIMHMGSLKSIGLEGKENFRHILLNNNCHDSVGGQKTNAFNINFEKLVNSLGYKKYFKISDEKNIKKVLSGFLKKKGPVFLEVICDQNKDQNLPRPKKLIQIKQEFCK